MPLEDLRRKQQDPIDETERKVCKEILQKLGDAGASVPHNTMLRFVRG